MKLFSSKIVANPSLKLQAFKCTWKIYAMRRKVKKQPTLFMIQTKGKFVNIVYQFQIEKEKKQNQIYKKKFIHIHDCQYYFVSQ